MSLVGFLTACSKDFVSTEYGFRPVSVDTPAGGLSIKVKGVSKKTGKREWVTGEPWKLWFLLRSSSPVNDENCTVTVQNLSVIDQADASKNTVVQWDNRESDFRIVNPDDEFPVAIMTFPAKGFEYGDYRLTFGLRFSDQCALSPNRQEIEVALDSNVEVSKASLWDNLMGI